MGVRRSSNGSALSENRSYVVKQQKTELLHYENIVNLVFILHWLVGAKKLFLATLNLIPTL
jgi:hypothetical protein